MSAQGETWLGWIRLSLATLAMFSLPLWAVITAVILQLEHNIFDPRPPWVALLWAGINAAAWLGSAMGIGLAVVLFVRPLLRWSRSRRSASRYDALVQGADALAESDWSVRVSRDDADDPPG